MIRVANAPCSWGALEFASTVQPAPASQVLDEMRLAGYVGTELGDWGFMPTEPAALAAEMAKRQLSLVGAFVPIALSRATAFDEGLERAVRTAQLIADAADNPLLVLSDDNGADAHRTARAGRITEGDGLTRAAWDGFAIRAETVARAVLDQTGLRTVFHHHCAGYVETPKEIDALMRRTDAALVGLCLDTGHLTFAGGNPIEVLDRYGDRVRHVHFKDCDPEVAGAARGREWDYHTAVRRGVFCELGTGIVNFAAICDRLRLQHYAGWIVVEQDVLPGLGTPLASATRNREFLRQLGL